MFQRNKTISIILLMVTAVVAIVTMVLAYFIVPDHWVDTDQHLQNRTPLLIVMGVMFVSLAIMSAFFVRHPEGLLMRRQYKLMRRQNRKGSLTLSSGNYMLMRVGGKLKLVDASRVSDPEGYGLIQYSVTILGIVLLLLSLAVLRFLPAWNMVCQIISLVIIVAIVLVVLLVCKRHYVVNDEPAS